MEYQFEFEARNEAFDKRPTLSLSESLLNGGDIVIIANRAGDEEGRRFTLSFRDRNYDEIESARRDSWKDVVSLFLSYGFYISRDSENAVRAFLAASARIF